MTIERTIKTMIKTIMITMLTTGVLAGTVQPIAQPIVQKNTIELEPGVYQEFKNGGIENGQELIDNNKELASSYYGEPYNPNDDQPTHFIGHKGSKFDQLNDKAVGSVIIVHGEDGGPTEYTVTKKDTISVVFLANGINKPETPRDLELFKQVLAPNQGEVLWFQVCTEEREDGFRILLVKAEKRD